MSGISGKLHSDAFGTKRRIPLYFHNNIYIYIYGYNLKWPYSHCRPSTGSKGSWLTVSGHIRQGSEEVPEWSLMVLNISILESPREPCSNYEGPYITYIPNDDAFAAAWFFLSEALLDAFAG